MRIWFSQSCAKIGSTDVNSRLVCANATQIIVHVIAVSVGKKHSSGEEDPWEDELAKHQIRGWGAISSTGLHGQGSHKRNVFSKTPVSSLMR